MTIVEEIQCAHCGGPIHFEPGEVVGTCPYCGFTQIIKTGTPFTFEHSMLTNRYNADEIESVVRKWMRSGFAKPRNLAKASKIIEQSLVYVPFWVIEAEAITNYKGIFERLTPPVVKEGKIEKHYHWLVLARNAAEFPTREYDVPLKGKIPYDFRRIEGFAKVLNSEIDKAGALDKAKEQIEAHHLFLIQQDVDRVIEKHTDFKFGDTVYLHAPIWFVTYDYQREQFKIVLDASTGTMIAGDIPATSFGLF